MLIEVAEGARWSVYSRDMVGYAPVTRQTCKSHKIIETRTEEIIMMPYSCSVHIFSLHHIVRSGLVHPRLTMFPNCTHNFRCRKRRTINLQLSN